ncbi:MAG: hypothetical protein R3A48_02555 [Polyangiales bacterium]
MRPLSIFCAALLQPLAAGAYADHGPPPRESVALVRVSGRASVRGARAEVRCRSGRVLERWARCTVRAEYALEAHGDVTLASRLQAGDEVTVDGARLGTELRLAEGARAIVRVSVTRSLETTTRVRESPWVFAPMVVRHPFFGESRTRRYQGDRAEVDVISGTDLELVDEPALDREHDPVLQVTFDRERLLGSGMRVRRAADATRAEQCLRVAIGLTAREEPTGPLMNGGPVLALGSRISTQGAPSRFMLRGAYEVGLFEHLFVSASVETDFESLMESLVVDVASPNYVILIPSFRLGVGVVARQLGPRPADFALRLRAGMNLLPGGFDADFDYWPELGGWTISLTGRLSP